MYVCVFAQQQDGGGEGGGSDPEAAAGGSRGKRGKQQDKQQKDRKKDKKGGKEDRAQRRQQEEAEARQRAELEMLLMDEQALAGAGAKGEGGWAPRASEAGAHSVVRNCPAGGSLGLCTLLRGGSNGRAGLQ